MEKFKVIAVYTKDKEYKCCGLWDEYSKITPTVYAEIIHPVALKQAGEGYIIKEKIMTISDFDKGDWINEAKQ